MKRRLDAHDSSARYISYIVGFILSVLVTLAAYIVVVEQLWPTEVLVYIILAMAVVQLVVQSVFFLHIGRGNKWKLITYLFAVLIVLIIVVGSLWIMSNLNYNMMQMTPEQMELYMQQNEGI